MDFGDGHSSAFSVSDSYLAPPCHAFVPPCALPRKRMIFVTEKKIISGFLGSVRPCLWRKFSRGEDGMSLGRRLINRIAQIDWTVLVMDHIQWSEGCLSTEDTFGYETDENGDFSDRLGLDSVNDGGGCSLVTAWWQMSAWEISLSQDKRSVPTLTLFVGSRRGKGEVKLSMHNCHCVVKEGPFWRVTPWKKTRI